MGLSPAGAHVGIMTFQGGGGQHETILLLSEGTNQQAVIDTMPILRGTGSGTQIAQGLNWAADNLLAPGTGVRAQSEYVPRVVILLTDGEGGSAADVKAAADTLRSDCNATVYAVGVGDSVNSATLHLVAEPTAAINPGQVYLAADFSALAGVLDNVFDAACSPPVAETVTQSPTQSPTSAPFTSAPTMSPTQSPTTSSPTSSPTQSPTTSAPTQSPTSKGKKGSSGGTSATGKKGSGNANGKKGSSSTSSGKKGSASTSSGKKGSSSVGSTADELQSGSLNAQRGSTNIVAVTFVGVMVVGAALVVSVRRYKLQQGYELL
jgi:hypothetical protein